MKKSALCLIFSLMLICLGADIFPVPQLPWSPLTYTAFKTDNTITADGILDEPDWRKAAWTEDFVDIEGELKPLPFLRTRVKMLWDDDWLYIAAEMEEPQLWATLTQRDAVIFHDNDFEVFIDPDSDTHDYYEWEINALGTLWDLFLIKPYRDRDQVAINAWDIRDMQYGIQLKGTLNDPSDIDEGWVLEMKVPMYVLKECAHKPVPPVEGDFWRLNFSRVHWELEVVDGKYRKVAGKPEYNWVWSPQGLIAMHYPERWGYLFFSHQPPGTDLSYNIPAREHDKELLRQLYYLQKQYQYTHKRFARSLKSLNIPAELWQKFDTAPRIESTSKGYIVHYKDLWIREDGLTN